jgi:hypothetical protein
MTNTKSDFKSRLRQQAEESIGRDLANHTIVQMHRDGEPGRIWKCSNKGSSVYAFTVCAPPGWLIVYGDMGECMWSRHRDMLPFIRSSIGSLDYFSEKASKDCLIREERTELAQEWLDQAEQDWQDSHGSPMNDQQQEQLQEIREAFESYGEIADLQRAIYEARMFDSFSAIPSCRYYTYQYLWTIEALKWFIQKLDAGEFTKNLNFQWCQQDDRYLLQNCTAGFVGNSPLFWHKDDSGYTPWIADAKRWTKLEAEQQIRACQGSHTFKMWPAAQIESNAKATVDMQDLQKN